MRMTVVNIRKMRVAMPLRCVVVRVCVRLRACPRKIMFVLMVFVVNVFMRVIHRLMQVIVPVVFRQVQPHTQRHQRGGNPKRQRRGFAKK